jgi:hypothetical protein
LNAAPPGEKPPKFQRYRLALLVTASAVGAAFALLLVTSIVVDLFFSRRDTRQPATLSRAELVACNQSVRDMLEALVRKTAELESRSDLGDLSADWDDFAEAWQREFGAVGERCGFNHMDSSGMGTGYDRMAWVYRHLPTTKLKFRDLMAHYSRDLNVEIAEMRDALSKSQEALEKRATAKDNSP